MNRLAVLARVPSPGQVKTRLSPALPSVLSAKLHVAMLTDTLSAALGAGADGVDLFWAPAGGLEPGLTVPDRVVVHQQRGADLGERLSAAFAELLTGPADRGVAIGADCPDLASGTIREAFAALDEHDLVLGPAEDGGYYLIGLRRPVPILFRGVSWGTGRVLEQTLARAERAGLAVRTLGTLGDIDTPRDLVRFIGRRSLSPCGPGPSTEAALREMGLLPPRG